MFWKNISETDIFALHIICTGVIIGNTKQPNLKMPKGAFPKRIFICPGSAYPIFLLSNQIKIGVTYV